MSTTPELEFDMCGGAWRSLEGCDNPWRGMAILGEAWRSLEHWETKLLIDSTVKRSPKILASLNLYPDLHLDDPCLLAVN